MLAQPLPSSPDEKAMSRKSVSPPDWALKGVIMAMNIESLIASLRHNMCTVAAKRESGQQHLGNNPVVYWIV